MNDMTAKGRQAKGLNHGTHTKPNSRAKGDRHGSRIHPELRPKGETHGMVVLSESIVIQIRQRCGGGESQRKVAKELGVHQGTVSRIVTRKIWSHI